MYKNFGRLLQAFSRSGLVTSYELRVISPYGTSFTPAETEHIHRLKLADRVKLIPSASEDELRASYARATAFVYPSEYEGFGLPIWEAFASGTIVAASSTSSLREVGGDAAIYFDPFDVDDMATALCSATGLSPHERHARIERGLAHARLFSWHSCQQKTLAAIDNLLANQTVHS